MLTIIILVILCLSAACIIMFWHIYNEKKINRTKMSFKESLDLVGLPIVTFYQGDKKFHFLLDSGASNNCINTKFLKILEYSDTNKKSSVYGMEGNTVNTGIVVINLYYKGNHFSDEFISIDISKAFDEVKKECNIEITGILGSEFLSKYKYILDYKDNIAYMK